MRISIETTVLADPSAALGRIGPANLSLNGHQVIDETDFFRAATPSFFVRGGGGVTLQFNVERVFTTLKAAETFLLTHFGAIPLAGLVTLLCGDAGDQQTVFLRHAVVDAVALPGYRGASVGVQYTIRGGAFETDIPSEEIPGDPGDDETFITMRRGKIAIGSGATSVDVLFSSPLSAVPVVSPSISRPAGSAEITCVLDEDSVSVNGFTVQLSAATPDTTYKLHYIAVQ